MGRQEAKGGCCPPSPLTPDIEGFLMPDLTQPTRFLLWRPSSPIPAGGDETAQPGAPALIRQTAPTLLEVYGVGYDTQPNSSSPLETIRRSENPGHTSASRTHPRRGAALFVLGKVTFYVPSQYTTGVTLFLLGSVLMLVSVAGRALLRYGPSKQQTAGSAAEGSSCIRCNSRGLSAHNHDYVK